MLSTLIAMAVFAPAQAQQNPVMCPVAPEPAVASVAKVDYNGVRYGFCCGGCVGTFEKDPTTYIKKAAEEKKVVGTSLYDPVAGVKVDYKKSSGYTDYLGTRFYFANANNKKAFDANPAKFGKAPEKALLYCSVMGHGLKSYADAGAYVDHKGVRFFFCCPNCLAEFNKNPGKYEAQANKAKAPAAMKAPADKNEPTMFAQAGKGDCCGKMDAKAANCANCPKCANGNCADCCKDGNCKACCDTALKAKADNCANCPKCANGNCADCCKDGNCKACCDTALKAKADNCANCPKCANGNCADCCKDGNCKACCDTALKAKAANCANCQKCANGKCDECCKGNCGACCK
jgi:YHS domain-containing protein